MNLIDSEKLKEKSSNKKLDASELVEVLNNTPCNFTHNSEDSASYDKTARNIFPHGQNALETLEKRNIYKYSATCGTSHTENPDAVDTQNFHDEQNGQSSQKDSSVLHFPVLNSTNNAFSSAEDSIKEITSSGKLSVAVVKTLRPLCADYKSDSGSESVDSESDSSTVSANSTSETSSEDEYASDESCDSGTNKKEKKLEEKNLRKDLSLSDLPPIEDLKINVPEDECVEIGTITSIVETLVVVESYKGTAALDLDTVLFLDCGKRTLGRVFDILGPVNEPVYTVRFNSQEQIKSLSIEKNLKVYYAPKTQHTTFVFMSEVLKNRGSDASWKDNAEAPPEFQDFSDDEQERLHKNKQIRETDRENLSLKEQIKSKKRPYNKVKHSPGVFQTSGFRNPNFCSQRRPNIQRNTLGSQSAPSLTRFPSGHPSVFDPIQTPPFPYNLPPHPSVNAVPIPSRACFPSRFSGPSFPAFGSLSLFNQNQNFQHSFYQQRTHGYLQTFGSWGRPTRPTFRYQFPPPPPPPPPPPAEQSDHRP